MSRADSSLGHFSLLQNKLSLLSQNPCPKEKKIRFILKRQLSLRSSPKKHVTVIQYLNLLLIVGRESRF